MEEKFKKWLLNRGYAENGAVQSYSKAIPLISNHYSKETGSQIDIYKISDQTKISGLAHDYSQTGKFSSFGYEHHGRFRAAMSRYSEFFAQYYGGLNDSEVLITKETLEETEISNVNFSYERDLQITLCAQISELFPNYKIYGDFKLRYRICHR